METGIEYLIDKIQVIDWNHSWYAKVIKKAKQIDDQQKIDFANWCRIQDNKYPNRIITIQQLFDEYNKQLKTGQDETYTTR